MINNSKYQGYLKCRDAVLERVVMQVIGVGREECWMADKVHWPMQRSSLEALQD